MQDRWDLLFRNNRAGFAEAAEYERGGGIPGGVARDIGDVEIEGSGEPAARETASLPHGQIPAGGSGEVCGGECGLTQSSEKIKDWDT